MCFVFDAGNCVLLFASAVSLVLFVCVFFEGVCVSASVLCVVNCCVLVVVLMPVCSS